MNEGDRRVRQVAVLAASLAMTVSVGLAYGGAANAAPPSLRVEPGSTWLAEPRPGGCELEIFSENGTWTSQFDGAAGTWSGGDSTIRMTWTRRTKGLTFSGDFAQSVHGHPDYEGKFSFEGYVFPGQLIKGTRC